MKIHMVKSGETMYDIAQKYGVTLEQLIAFNPQISNPDQIDVGMKVKIPAASSHDGAPSVEYAHKHTVLQGDSLWKIAKAWGLPLKALVDANPQLKNPSVLLTGEVVYIPKQDFMENTGMNTNTSNTMNVNSAVSPAANLPNVANSLSPAYTPVPTVAPQPIAAAPPIVEAPKPVEEKIQSENSIPIFDKTNVENLNIQPAESNKEMMNVYSSESLFMQYDVPAVEANSNVNYPPAAYQVPAWNSNEAPQWEPPHDNYAAPINTAPNNAAKPDCDCGCGGKASVMPYANVSPFGNEMPHYGNAAPYGTNINAFSMNAMPDNSYSALNSAMPSYYVPQPMLAYSPQPQDQQSAMPFAVSGMEATPIGYMMPCYPMGSYGDMGHLHGMQTPYSPWMGSNESAPIQSLADTSNNPAAFNEQVNGVLGTEDQEAPSKKQIQSPRKPAGRTQQKQSTRTVLHEFLQKKSNPGLSRRESKINEPWMNR